MDRKISIGFSPCPNDTFIFEALMNNRIKSDLVFQPVMADVEELNQMATKGVLDVTKLSFAAFFHCLAHYQMMDSGAALGRGVGPLLITNQSSLPEDQSEWKVALPGELTTAHLLFSYAYPEVKQKTFLLFSEIEQKVLNGTVDAGVIIHENRFTYASKGLRKIKDLGEYWEMKQKVPIPLGGIAVRRDFPDALKLEIQAQIRQSVEFALENPSISEHYVTQFAQEMDRDVQAKHIQTYVNNYSVTLGREGRNAISVLKNVFQEINHSNVDFSLFVEL